MNKLYSNEIVFRGHPDKVCDQISAAILKECVSVDKNTRAGIECVGGKGKIFITGELTTKATPDIDKIVRDVLESCGYNSKKYKIIDNIGRQSNDIALGVDVGGAGDNGMMFGYACDDTPQMLPLAQVILQVFAKNYDTLRIITPNIFFPDGKAQITGIYDSNMKLLKIKTFTICYQNCETQRIETDKFLIDYANKLCSSYGIKVEQFLINPTGRFNIGGFDGDAGLTGRKIVIDTYQSFANVGGGCMNGKDATKVDFSGAHKARELAKRMLKKHNLHWCQIQLSYAIGQEEPLAIYITSDIGDIIPPKEMFEECKPTNIIRDLKLLDIDYEQLARFGHFTN